MGSSGRRINSYIRCRAKTSLYRSKLRQIRAREWTDLSCPGDITPIKYVSIPRLALMAAVVGVRLAETISEKLNTLCGWAESLKTTEIVCC